MLKLYVLYDTRCELCLRLKEWLLAQRCWLQLEMIPAGSDLAGQMFPELEQIASSDDLVVISDDGKVYLNNQAWIMCLYALEKYRTWACRLAHPLLLPLARQAFDTLSKNRHAISRWLGDNNPDKIANELRQVTLGACQPDGTVSDYLR
jgi:predicted DCC family thiol-disulfide oxidoreductase YuxK